MGDIGRPVRHEIIEPIPETVPLPEVAPEPVKEPS